MTEEIKHIEILLRLSISIIKKLVFILVFSYFQFSLKAQVETIVKTENYQSASNWSYLAIILQRQNFDLIISNDLEPLVLANELQNKAKLIWDAYEYYPNEINDKLHLKILLKNYFDRKLKQYAQSADLAYTVSEGCAKEYKNNYNIQYKLVLNATQYVDIKPQFSSLEPIKIGHYGVAVRSRKAELMIESVLTSKKNFVLDLYFFATGISGSKYLQELNATAEMANFKLDIINLLN